jgi:cytochrome c peroxidase
MRKQALSIAAVLILTVAIAGGLSAGPFPVDPAGGNALQAAAAEPSNNLTPLQNAGKMIFFDTNLSLYKNQSCAACHGPKVGWTGPEASINALGAVYMGSVDGRFGNRKPPTSAYAGFSPVLHEDPPGTWVGGMFWDGRATGATLGDPLAEQAMGPFLNPLEQAMPDPASVVDRVCKSNYRGIFKAAWGPAICQNVANAYEAIARSIAAYERSSEVTKFSSKYDLYLKGKAKLTASEANGLALFNSKGKCAQCHPSTPGPYDPTRPLFTDYTYDNLGVPKNPLNPFYYNFAYNPLGVHWVDLGLGGFLNDPSQYGKQKVPTLRNVDLRPYPIFVKAFSHNGYFKSLEAIVHFYNTRDVLPACSEPLAIADRPGVNCWPAAEYGPTVNHAELGNLGLTDQEEADIVAFMKTLNDL